MRNDIQEILVTHDEIQKRAIELGEIITKDYQGKDVTLQMERINSFQDI